MDKNSSWRFGVVGNIITSHMDECGNTLYGTYAFLPGTKVYIDGNNWCVGRSELSVVGLNRFGCYALEQVKIEWIENIRTQKIYKPHILQIIDNISAMDGIEWWGRTATDRKDTEKFVEQISTLYKEGHI